MLLKRCRTIIILAAAVFLLSACGTADSGAPEADKNAAGVTQSADAGDGASVNKEGAADNAEAEGKEAEGEKAESEERKERILPQPGTDYVTDAMYQRATEWIAPELERLAAVMRKAERGEEITVAVIGGSITQGSSASKITDSYAYLMKEWWETAFPDTKVNYVNAGIGATDSYLGVHRAEDELLAHAPDFVIVEFSVNDSNTNFYKTSYDNLVRRILGADNMPAVLLLFMTMEDGTSAQGNDSLIGFKYHLPMLSYREAVLQEIEEKSFTWKDISPDNIHPNTKGHAIAGELIWRYLNSVYEQLDSIGEPTAFAYDPVTKDAYMSGRLLENDDIKPEAEGSFTEGSSWYVYPDGWSTTDGGSIVFTVEAARIGILYYKSTTGDYGKAEVIIDGTSVTTLDGAFKGGWGSYGTAVQVFDGKESGTHTVELRMREGSGSCFDICALLVSD